MENEKMCSVLDSAGVADSKWRRPRISRITLMTDYIFIRVIREIRGLRKIWFPLQSGLSHPC